MLPTKLIYECAFINCAAKILNELSKKDSTVGVLVARYTHSRRLMHLLEIPSMGLEKVDHA